MIVLVCGGRDFGKLPVEYHALREVLDEVHSKTPITLLVHGAAQGTDLAAEDWARLRQLPYLGVPARWDAEGQSAGPQRNERMLNTRTFLPFLVPVKLVIAFPGGVGTNHMKEVAHSHGVRVWEPFAPTTPGPT